MAYAQYVVKVFEVQTRRCAHLVISGGRNDGLECKSNAQVAFWV